MIVIFGDPVVALRRYHVRGTWAEVGTDAAYTDMLAAGERLLMAQRAEKACEHAYRRDPTVQNRAYWIQAQTAVDMYARQYEAATRSLLER